ncbi:MAG: ATP-binding protein, partial [Pseudomonadota bacterium]|nr:ATP-binding protein [Pseudomonadota bacterium]
HAGSNVSVEVSLSRSADKVVIAVKDDGRGCDLDAEQSGFGLAGMKQRVEALSGEFTVISQPMQGMQILAALPIGWKQ